MLALSRKQMTILFLVLVSFIVVMVASMIILRATNPEFWQHVDGLLPNIIAHY